MNGASESVLADDHAVVRQALRALLVGGGIDVVAEAADGWEAIRLAGEHRPDVAVLDFSMPRCSGLSAAEAISRHVSARRHDHPHQTYRRAICA